jgi:hypothetical protein
MTRLFSTVCLVVGLALVGVSVEPAIMQEVAEGLLGARADAAGVAAALAVAASLMGMGLMIVAFVGWARQARIDVGWSSFQDALAEVAASHGAQLRRQHDRLVFTAGVDGLVFEVSLRPTQPGSVEVGALLPALQRIELLSTRARSGASLEERFAAIGTHRGGGGEGWEVRSAGGPRAHWLATSPPVRVALDRLFAWRVVRRLVQDRQGARVVADLVPPHELAALIEASVGALLAVKGVAE